MFSFRLQSSKESKKISEGKDHKSVFAPSPQQSLNHHHLQPQQESNNIVVTSSSSDTSHSTRKSVSSSSSPSLPHNGSDLSSTVSSLDSDSPTAAASFRNSQSQQPTTPNTKTFQHQQVASQSQGDWLNTTSTVETSNNLDTTMNETQNDKKCTARITKVNNRKSFADKVKNKLQRPPQKKLRQKQPVSVIVTPQKTKNRTWQTTGSGPLNELRNGTNNYHAAADAGEHFDKGCRLWQEEDFEEAELELQKALKIQELKLHNRQRQLPVHPSTTKDGGVTVEEATKENTILPNGSHDAIDRAKTHYSLGMVHLSQCHQNHHHHQRHNSQHNNGGARQLQKALRFFHQTEALKEFRSALRLFCWHLGGDHILSKSAALRISDTLREYTQLSDMSIASSSTTNVHQKIGEQDQLKDGSPSTTKGEPTGVTNNATCGNLNTTSSATTGEDSIKLTTVIEEDDIDKEEVNLATVTSATGGDSPKKNTSVEEDDTTKEKVDIYTAGRAAGEDDTEEEEEIVFDGASSTGSDASPKEATSVKEEDSLDVSDSAAGDDDFPQEYTADAKEEAADLSTAGSTTEEEQEGEIVFDGTSSAGGDASPKETISAEEDDLDVSDSATGDDGSPQEHTTVEEDDTKGEVVNLDTAGSATGGDSSKETTGREHDDKEKRVDAYIRSVLVAISHEKRGDAAMNRYYESTQMGDQKNRLAPKELLLLALWEYTMAVKNGPREYHPHLALLHQKKAYVYGHQGKWKQSSNEYCHALTIYTPIFGCEHHATLGCLKQFSQAKEQSRKEYSVEVDPRGRLNISRLPQF